MKIGLTIANLTDIGKSIARTAELGIHSCQICGYDVSRYTDGCVREILDACRENDVTMSTYWAGWSGPKIWNVTEGPVTLGLLPGAYRRRRIADLKAGADFAQAMGVSQIATHMGFIPENPHDPEFPGMMDAIREVAEYCDAKHMKLLFETGQESPGALLRAIEAVGTGNLGINLDTANPILYGKANPVDILEMLGDYVFDVHIKDGRWPTNGWELGEETPVGEGKVDFPKIVRMLKQRGYDGALTIEREIEGEQQTRDILKAKQLLEKWLAEE